MTETKVDEKRDLPERPDAYRRYRTFLSGAGVPPRFVTPLTKLALSWLGKGVDIFSERFKAYKKIYISMVTSDPDSVKDLHEGYFSRTRSGNLKIKVKPIKEFFDWSLTQKDGIGIARAWLDLLYTVLPRKVTNEVFQEWKAYVDTPPTVLTDREIAIFKSVLQDFKQIHGPLDRLRFKSQVGTFVSLEDTGRRSPYYNWMTNRMVSSPRNNLVCYHWVPLWTTSEKLYSFYQKFPSQVNQCLLGTDTRKIPKRSPSFHDVTPIGSIACILEQGAKYRWIANPHISVQMVGEPIKECFDKASRRTPWVYTFDQDRGRSRISSLQKPGLRIHCFDASKFTDTFSREFQKMVCSELAACKSDGEFMTDYIEIISSAPWQFSAPGGLKELISWKSGQPLGTGPSFHIACFSHAMVLYLSSFLSQLTPEYMQVYLSLSTEDRCRVFADFHQKAYTECSSLTGCVGDDSYIASDKIAQAYDFVMHRLGVKINKSKSIVSDILAEFCGKWVVRNKIIPSSKPVMLYSHYAQINDEIRKYGERMLQSVPFSEITLFRVLPILSRPKSMGGTGLLNPAKVLTKAGDSEFTEFMRQSAFELFCSGLLVNDVSERDLSRIIFAITEHTVPREKSLASQLESQYLGFSKYYDLNNQWYDCTLCSDGTGSPDLINEFSKLPAICGNNGYSRNHRGSLKFRQPTFYDLTDNFSRCYRDRHEWYEHILDRYKHEIVCSIGILLGGPPQKFIPFNNKYLNEEVPIKESAHVRIEKEVEPEESPYIYTPYQSKGSFYATSEGYKWFADYRAQSHPKRGRQPTSGVNQSFL